MRLFSTLSLLICTFAISAHNHEEPKFEGLLSSDVFNLDGGMELYVEKRSTCNAGSTPKHFHPAAGTLVYVLDGVSQSKSSGEWKQYSKGQYWYERTDWVHGGENDTPDLGEACTDLLVIRVVDQGKDHTVFVK
jgi:quercetin dioxygenase-like cupin family protein